MADLRKIDNSTDVRLNRVYTDKAGNHWYCNINPLNISAVRGLSAEKAKRFAGMKLDEHNLRRLLKEANTAGSLGDFMKMASIYQEISYRLEFVIEEQSVLDLVFMYYFLQDEDPDEASDYHNATKRALLMEDTAARSFFLRIGVAIMSRSSGIPEEDLLGYLAKTKEEADRIYRFISRQSPSDLMNAYKASSTTQQREDPKA